MLQPSKTNGRTSSNIYSSIYASDSDGESNGTSAAQRSSTDNLANTNPSHLNQNLDSTTRPLEQSRVSSSLQVQPEDHSSIMDVDEEPFDLIAGTKICEHTPPFAPVEISTGCLYDTNLPARPYAVNIVLSLLSEEESQSLIMEINAIQRVSSTYQQCYNSTYTYLCSSALQIFSFYHTRYVPNTLILSRYCGTHSLQSNNPQLSQCYSHTPISMLVSSTPCPRTRRPAYSDVTIRP